MAADSPYAVYGREIASAVMEDGLLDVPSGFLGDRTTLPLWFHPNYALLEEYIEASMATRGESSKRRRWEDKPGKFHLVGTPGIGKSYFGHYWFYKQAKRKSKVVWRTKGDHPQFAYYDFSLDDPLVHVARFYEVPPGWSWSEMLGVWMIVDGESRGIVDHKGPALQCVSPGRAGYHEYSKDTGEICHLGAWSLEDLKACRDAIGLELDDAQLEKRFYICGGLPRLIFSRTLSLDRLEAQMKWISAATGKG